MNLLESKAALPEAIEAGSVEDIVQLLDNYAQSGGSRMKLKVIDGENQVISRKYHHGRCDVDSPWSKGQAFDVLENGDNES